MACARRYFSRFLTVFGTSGDTSSDEIVGHMFVLPIVHDLLAKTDEERAMARDLMCSNMDYIIDNGFTLVDADGNVTTWGRWCVSCLQHWVALPLSCRTGSQRT